MDQFSVYRGEDKTLTFVIDASLGLDLTAAKLTYSICRRFGDEPVVRKRSANNSGSDAEMLAADPLMFKVMLAGTDTDIVAPGQYVVDAFAVDGAGKRYVLVAPQAFVIRPTSTTFG